MRQSDVRYILNRQEFSLIRVNEMELVGYHEREKKRKASEKKKCTTHTRGISG